MPHLAIISNGPSAKLFDRHGRDVFDHVVGVNWTVTRWACDWWCFCDWTTFAETRPLGLPRIFLKRTAKEKISTHAPAGTDIRFADYDAVIHEEVVDIPMAKEIGFWNNFSGVAALGMALYLQADRVTVFGADMNGDLDHSGLVGNSRTEDRWDRERGIWNASVEYLWKQGINVERILR